MMFKTHLAFGFLIGLFLLQLLHPSNQILFLALVMAASILPDIDHPDSTIGRNFKIIGFLFEHRGFFHSVFALLLFTFPVYYFLKSHILGFAVLAGYGAHLLADCISKQGIMPLHPISRIKIRGFIKTNSFVEYVIFIVIIIVDVVKLIKL
jgi:inner membrane protein